jgi:hypothetical protein
MEPGWCTPVYDDFRLFCGMMEGLAFLPVPDLTNGIHLIRTLCPDDPPEAAELLDYFDSTYISGRLRQQNPAQNPFCWIIVRTVASSFRHHSITRQIDGWACPTRLKNYLFQPSRMLLVLASPLTVASCTFQMAGGNIGGLHLKTREATVRTIIQQDAVGNPSAKRTRQRHVQLHVRL